MAFATVPQTRALQSRQILRPDPPSRAFRQVYSRLNISLALSRISPRNSLRKKNTSSLQTPTSPQLSPAPRSFRKLDLAPPFPLSLPFAYSSSVPSVSACRRQACLANPSFTAAATPSIPAALHTSLLSLHFSRFQSLSRRSALCDSS